MPLRGGEHIETLEVIRRRIRATEEVQTVIGTMKGLAAVNVRLYQDAADAVDAYVRTIDIGLHAVVVAHPEVLHAPVVRRPQARTSILVVYGSDQGLCGPINRHVADHAAARLAEVASERRLVVAVGARLAHELERAGLPPDVRDEQCATVGAIAAHVIDLVVRIDGWRRRYDASEVILVHPAPLVHGRASYDLHAQRLWPVDPAWLADLRRRDWPTRMRPAVTTRPSTAFSHLLRQRLFAALVDAEASSLAAIEASRLAAMQAAEHNLDDRLDELRSRFHRQRQASITAELLDVVAGADAVASPEREP